MRKIALIAFTLILGLGLAVGLAWAGSSARAAINWQVLAGGGQPVASGNGVKLNGTLGQPVIGSAAGGQVQAGAGYWYGASRPSKVYLPIMLNKVVTAPDLRVDSLVATTTQITLVVRNAGNSPVTDGFWVDVYFNPNPAPPELNQTWQSSAPYGANWGVTAPLAPGEALTLTLGGPYYGEGSHTFPVGAQVYAYADSVNFATDYGNVRESDETNNTWGPVVSTVGLAQPAVTAPASLPDPSHLPGR
jgi:hypothetical protein